MRKIIFVILAVSIPWQKSSGGILDLTNGSFYRDSNAYFSDGNTMQTYPAGVPRTTTILSCSASDGQIIRGEGPAGEDIVPWCSNSKGLYGYNRTNPNYNQYLYLSEDGVTWRKIYTAPDIIRSIFAVADDMLIATINTSEPYDSNEMIYYSADYGVTWQPCVNADGGGPVILPGGGPYPWNFYQRPPKEGEPYGTIIVSTYTSTAYYHQIWRSTDNGITWKKVLELEPYYITHFHAVGYHAGLDKWVADTGDNTNPNPPYNTRMHTFVSDDDGQTWHEYAYNSDGTGKQSNTGQVIRFLDYGHPTRILLASDDTMRIGWVDLVTWETGTFMKAPPVNTNGETFFYYDVFKYDNLWYACLWSYGNAYNHHSAIYVSPDLEHWAIYHRFSDASVQGGNQFAGFVGGKLHIRTTTDNLSVNGHFSISPAKVSLVDNNAIVLTPPKTNNMTGTQSECNSTTQWSTSNPHGNTVFTTVSDNFFAGDKSIYISNPEPDQDIYVYSPAIDVVPGQTYIPRFWVQGSVEAPNSIKIGITTVNRTLLTYQIFPLLDDNQWTEVWGNVYTVPPGITSLRLACILRQSQVYPQIEAWLGAAELAQTPASPWQLGHNSLAQETLDHPVTLTPGFTHVFSTELIPSTSEMGSNPLYLCTYYIDTNEYVELFYDTTLNVFTLQSTTSDPNLGAYISSDPRWFNRSAAVKVAVRYLNGVLALSIADGNGIEHISNTLVRQGAPLDGTSRIIRTGDHNGGSVMPQKLYDNYLFNRVLSNQEIESIFNVPRISDANVFPPPEAFIDSITPNPAEPGQTVTFTGHGTTDANGSIVAYNWNSSLDGNLSDAASFSTALLSPGGHIITFTVTDDHNLVSSGATQILAINIPCSSKFNLDGDPLGYVDFNDLAIFVSNWLAEGPAITGDFNNDGVVDFFDFALFSTHWLNICDGP